MDHGLTSIIVVAADSGAMLVDCVERALHSDVPVELVLIDNGSRDGVPQAIEAAHAADPRLKLIYNRANLGFGPAINRAERATRGDALLILNPDCMLEADTVRRLRRGMQDAPNAGVIGAVVMDADGSPDPASCRRDPLLHRVGATLRDRHAADGLYVAPPWPRELTQVEAISGALMLLPRQAFQRVGGFDEAYFLHFEDLDLCRRLRDAGFQVLLAGDVRVHHAKGTSSAHRPVFVSRHKHAGLWRWLRRFDPGMARPWTAGTVWLAIWAHFALEVPRLCRRRVRRASRCR